MKQDIALPYKKEKKSKKGSVKKFINNFFKNPPKDKLVRVTTYIGSVLAVVALVLAFIPQMNDFGLWLAVLAVALELFGFFKKDGKLPKKMLVITTVVFVIAGASVVVQNIYEQSQIDHQMYLQSGEATRELLDKDVTISIGDWSEKGLEIKVKNNNQDNKQYGIFIEARSKDGSVVESEMVSTPGIAPGRDATMTIFSSLTKKLNSGQKEALNDAEYQIISVSQF